MKTPLPTRPLSQGHTGLRRLAARAVLLTGLATMAAVPSFAEPGTSSTTGSRAASELIGEGSLLVVSGTAELLSTGGQLVIDSVTTTARGVRLVLRPVGHSMSAAAEFSAAVTVELSHAAWGAASHGVIASGRVVGAALQTVVLTAGSAATAGSAVVVGTALVLGDLVLGIVPAAELHELMHHGVHDCEHTS